MKKLIAILLAALMCASLLTACSVGECDVCGEFGVLSDGPFGLEICSDCD